MKTIVHVAAGLAALMLAGASHAENAAGGYPARQVRIIVPYPAGGPTDVMARLVAQHLSESLGQSFFVENLTGASGVVGTVAAANSPGDGHTLLFVTNDFAVAPTVSSKVNYDAVKSFAPVTITAASPQVVVVHPSFPAKNMQELITLATANPGKYNYASLGIGFGQLSSERLFRLGLGLDVVRVPFPGAAPIITSTLAGHTPIAFLGLPPAAPHIKEGDAARARRHQRQALAGVSRRSDHGGIRRARPGVRADHRRGRPRGDPEAYCRPLAAPDRAHRRAARRETEARRARFLAGRQHARSLCRPDQGRHRDLEQGRARRQYQGRLTLEDA